jgi:hypothetical protein
MEAAMTQKVTDNDTGGDAKGAVEGDVERIRDIKGSETLGYKGEAHEEHTGQATPRRNPDPKGDLADNDPDQLPPK